MITCLLDINVYKLTETIQRYASHKETSDMHQVYF